MNTIGEFVMRSYEQKERIMDAIEKSSIAMASRKEEDFFFEKKSFGICFFYEES